MKIHLLLMLTALVASAATAGQEQIKHCKEVGVIASDVMQMRQNGVALPEVLDKAVGHKQQNIFLFMLQTAYRLPIVPDDKQVAIDAFRDQQILSCLANMKQRR